MQLDPIGLVRSCYGSKFAVPRQPGLCPSAWGELVLHEKYRSSDALRGIEGFSHLWLIFGFHETVDAGWKPTVRPPRLGGNQRIGVFASRSTFRPNGLGLSLVRLEGIDERPAEGPVLKLGGLDLIDGTPVFDIKPYLPYAEALPGASGGFAGEEPVRLPVSVDAAAQKNFAQLPVRAQAAIREVLALDPRPAVQKGDEDRLFGAGLCGYEVKFRVTAAGVVIAAVFQAPASGLMLRNS